MHRLPQARNHTILSLIMNLSMESTIIIILCGRKITGLRAMMRMVMYSMITIQPPEKNGGTVDYQVRRHRQHQVRQSLTNSSQMDHLR